MGYSYDKKKPQDVKGEVMRQPGVLGGAAPYGRSASDLWAKGKAPGGGVHFCVSCYFFGLFLETTQILVSF